jgi:Spy/CpxP family protein refolding chaperone
MNARAKWLMLGVCASALLAGVTAMLVTDWTLHRHEQSHTHDAAAQADLHAWMHEHLDLTPEQHAALAPDEAQYEKQRDALRGEILAAGRELATALTQAAPGDAQVEAALKKLNQAQAALQRATLDHFFVMKRRLRPAQAQKLLEWTHDSLTRQL